MTKFMRGLYDAKPLLVFLIVLVLGFQTLSRAGRESNGKSLPAENAPVAARR